MVQVPPLGTASHRGAVRAWAGSSRGVTEREELSWDRDTPDGKPLGNSCHSAVKSRKQTMDTPLFSPFLGALASPPAPLESSWILDPKIAEDFGSQNSFQECPKQRAPINLPYSGNGPDMFGLVSSILEEPNKAEAATDWNSLSGLFPPVWSPELGTNGDFPGLPNREFPNLLGHQEPPELELLHRGLGDLQLLESWIPPCAHPENSPVQNHTTTTQGGFSVPNCERHLSTDGRGRFRGDHEKCGSGFRPFSPRNRTKESPGVQKEFWKSERARGKALKNDAPGQTKHCADFSNQPVDKFWDKIPQDSHLLFKRHENFTAAHKLQLPLRPSLHFFNQPLKEQNFSAGTGGKAQEIRVHDGRRGFTFNNNNNNACQVNVGPKESAQRAAECDLSVKNVQNGSYSFQKQSLAAGADIPYGKQAAASPQSSSGVSTMSGGSPTHQPSYRSPLLPTSKNGNFQTSNGVSTHLGDPQFPPEGQRQVRPAGKPREDAGANKCRKFPARFSPDRLGQQKAAGEEDPEKHQRFSKKQENGSKDDGRGRRSWIPPVGSAGPNRRRFGAFLRKRERNGGSLSDLINPPPLPPLPFLSDFKQNPGFPPFNHPLFPSANNFNFPPPPLPFSDLADLFHCDDFNPLSPFMGELFPGEIPGPCFAFPTPFNKHRPARSRSGPATELHVRLEECCEQWRALEKERKKTEAELARHFPGQCIPSSSPVAVSRLPANPSRVDLLIADQARERARVLALIGRMERLCGAPVHGNISRTLELHLGAIEVTRARHRDELATAANPQRHRVPRWNNEKDVLALAAALRALAGATRGTRTALWCALQAALPKPPLAAPEKQQIPLLQGPLRDLRPPNTQENSSVEHEGKGGEKAPRILG